MIYIRTRARRSSTNPIWTLIDEGDLSARTHLSKRYTIRIESNNGYTLSDQVTSLVLSARLFRNTDGADITDLAMKHGVCPEWKWSVADNTMAVSGDAWSVTLVPDNVLRPARMECRIDEAAIDVRLFLNNVLLFQLTLPERGATYFAKIPLFIDTSNGISRTVIRESFWHR